MEERLTQMKALLQATHLIILNFFILTLSGCMYISPLHFDNISVDENRHTNYQSITSADKSKIRELTQDITNLSPLVDETEAYLVAYEAVLYPKVLANEYQLMTPPNYHNQMVNAGVRKKGHCYHFAQDLMKHLDRPYKTLTLERVMAFQGKLLEHNVPSIRAKGQDIQEAIILDAWRESADLLWMKVKDDDGYPWVRYVPPKTKT